MGGSTWYLKQISLPPQLACIHCRCEKINWMVLHNFVQLYADNSWLGGQNNGKEWGFLCFTRWQIRLLYWAVRCKCKRHKCSVCMSVFLFFFIYSIFILLLITCLLTAYWRSPSFLLVGKLKLFTRENTLALLALFTQRYVWLLKLCHLDLI